jgi:hypothetical protein
MSRILMKNKVLVNTDKEFQDLNTIIIILINV